MVSPTRVTSAPPAPISPRHEAAEPRHRLALGDRYGGVQHLEDAFEDELSLDPDGELAPLVLELPGIGAATSAVPEVERQLPFSAGTLGLWAPDHVVVYYVIYYRDGRVPPGTVVPGRVSGDVSIFDRRSSVTIRVGRVR